MRITVKRGDRYLIPKDKLAEASAKLARYEDTGLEPEQIIEMDRLYSEKCAEVGNLHARLIILKTQINIVLDEVDGQITDDPICEVREGLNGLLD